MLNAAEREPVENSVFQNGDTLQEKCGIVGVYSPDGGAVQDAYYAIEALQHRGQDGAGFSWVEVDERGALRFQQWRELGKIATGFNNGEQLNHITNPVYATAHNRYSTTEVENEFDGLQPLLIKAAGEEYTIGQNGQFNMDRLSEIAFEHGIVPKGSDTQIFSDILKRSIEEYKHIEPAMHQLLPQLEGAFNLIILGKEGLYAVRDRHAVRPLQLGVDGNSVMVASEIRGLLGKDTDGIPRLDYQFKEEVKPGTYMVINQDGWREERWSKADKKSCIFEKTYLSKADNIIDGQVVGDFRYEAGKLLAEVDPVEADLVIPVLGSAKFYAQGYAKASGIPYQDKALKKNPKSDRSFIEKSLILQQAAVRNKFSVDPKLVARKRVVVVDDSLVRGNTTRQIIGLLKDAGAEVHVRIGSDRYSKPCTFGVNVQSEDELLSTGRTLEEMRIEIGAASLAFLPLEKMHQAAKVKKNEVCDGCLGGSYPQVRELPEEDKLLPMAA